MHFPVWLRFVIGSAAGMLIGFIVPEDSSTIASLLGNISEVILRVGRYAVFPLFFCEIVLGIYHLRRRAIVRMYGQTFLLAGAISIVMVIIGVISILTIDQLRIPPVIQTLSHAEEFSASAFALALFPPNLLVAFIQELFIPIITVAILIGIAARSIDGSDTQYFISLIDNLSRIFYRIAAIIYNALGIGLIFIAAAVTTQWRSIIDFSLFSRLTLILIIDVVLIVALLAPLTIYLLKISKRPFAWLYAMVAPAFAGFFSGDPYFALSSLSIVSREQMNIPRKIGSAPLALAATFARGGTALVIATTFIVTLRSYSALEITFGQFVQIIVIAFVLSFALGIIKGNPIIPSLAVISQFNDSALVEGYLIIVPIAGLLLGLGTLLDVIIAGIITSAIAKNYTNKRLERYIRQE